MRIDFIRKSLSLTALLLVAVAGPAYATDCTVNGAPGLVGTSGNDIISCGTIDSGDTVYGGGGNDTIAVLEVAVYGAVDGGDGADTIFVLGVNDGWVVGGSGNDYITMYANADVVNGGKRNRHLCFGSEHRLQLLLRDKPIAGMQSMVARERCVHARNPRSLAGFVAAFGDEDIL